MRQTLPARALILSFLLLVMDASAGASTVTNTSMSTNQECSEGWCFSDNIGHPYAPPDSSPPVEEPGWWKSYGWDSNRNGMDDRLERIISGESESISPSSIIGPDNRTTVAIVVNYEWHPGPTDESTLTSTLEDHGWDRPDAWFFKMDILDSIVLDRVPVSALWDVLSLPGVVLIEQQNVLEPYLDVATKGSKVRASDLYQDSFWSNGFMGDGVVIAILDTGVDNEHFSLDDFSDSNQDNENQPSDIPDQKWIAGCDATSSNQVECSDGNFDPDDGDGHGTHVAGIALGTGDSDRVNIGYSPGSFLVDVKVLNDIGTTNSQASLKGINWVANNAETDWGNNQSSRGIDVMSMSFGSINRPGEDGQGDDGQNADARAVNAAVEAGIVAVAAIGNDGSNRITSVGAADLAITVGSIDDEGTVERGDDRIASYSNYGPRADDGDGDTQDELKPDVVAPGSGILSAEYAAPNPLPVGDQPKASDDYVNKDGTSMACPAVAGLAALILSYDDSLTPADIKNIIKETSEQRGAPSSPSLDNRWNNQYGYGIIDGETAFRCLIGGECTQIAGGVEWVHVESPPSNDWLIQGRTYSFSGTVNLSDPGAATVDAVEVSAELVYRKEMPNGQVKSFKSSFANVSNVSVIEDRWSKTFTIPEIEENGYYDAKVKFYATATNETGRRSQTNQSTHPLGKLDIGISEPEQDSTVSGSMNIIGSYSTVDGGILRWKIDDADWSDGPTLSQNNRDADGYIDEFQITIDTTDYAEGEHDVYLQIVAGDDILSEVVKRSIEIDNYPPRPNLMFIDDLDVTDYGIPLRNSVMGSFLEVRGEVRNDGDISANEVMVTLYENGQRRYESSIPKISVGEQVPFTLYWSPSLPGTKDVTVIVDSTNNIEELDESDNSISTEFEILPFRDGVDIVIEEGGVFSSPSIPLPGQQFILSTMVRNQGYEDATGLEITFLVKQYGTDGWLPISSRSLSMLPSGQNAVIEFPVSGQEAGKMEYRFTASGPSLVDEEWSNNQIEGAIVIDDSRVSSKLTSLPEDESVISVLSFRKTGLILASEGTQIIMHRIEESGAIVRCNTPLERFWSGSISTTVDDSSIAHLVWTRRLVTGTGVLSETVSYATVDDQCTPTVPQDLMSPLPLDLGDYFGVDLDEKDGVIVIAGYLRDLAGGTIFNPAETVFTLKSKNAQAASDWELVSGVIRDIDTMSAPQAPLEVEIGDELVHVLFISSRSDTSSEPVLGLWYAHGILGEEDWTYKKAIAVEGWSPSMAVSEVDGEERISVIWFEGSSESAVLRGAVVDESFNVVGGASVSVPARGAQYAYISQRGDALYVVYDYVSPVGPVVSLGVLDPENGWIGIGDRISSGRVHGVSERSDGLSIPFMVKTNSGGWTLVEVKSNGNLDDGSTNIFESARLALGLDESEFNVLLIGLTTAMLVILVSLLVGTVRQGFYNMKARRRSASVTIEADPEDALEVDDDAIEEVVPISISPPVEYKIEKMPDSQPPADPNNPFRTVRCGSCDARFELLKKIRRATCPSCGERIEGL